MSDFREKVEGRSIHLGESLKRKKTPALLEVEGKESRFLEKVEGKMSEFWGKV